jgi:predicted  nucleic acid-binding Zn-ribbon protein
MYHLPYFITLERIPGETICWFCHEKKKTRRGRGMSNDLTEVENELRSVSQEQHRVQEHIMSIQQHIGQDETWLKRNMSDALGYQETREELLALQAYVAELQAQVVSLDDVVLELTLEQEDWRNPALLLAS